MGKRKYLDKIEELFEKSAVVDFRSVERVIGKKKKSSYSKLLLRNLLKRGTIMRLTKGCYTKRPDINLAVFCFKPAYLGLQSALSYHGISEQETIPIILTAKNARTGIRKIAGNNAYIRKCRKKYLFCFEY